jgi:hypothetical protein
MGEPCAAFLGRVVVDQLVTVGPGREPSPLKAECTGALAAVRTGLQEESPWAR